VKHKMYEEFVWTTINRLYKILYKRKELSRRNINCDRCPYHGGWENGSFIRDRNWKRFRKTKRQYKTK